MPAMHITRSIVIDKPISDIRNVVTDFHHWRPWSPWLIAEPEATLDVRADGKYYNWKGKRVGSGEMTVLYESHDRIDYDLTFKPHAGRFEEAIVNFPGIWGLDAAIDMITRLGTLQIEQHILKLTRLGYEGLKARNYRVVSPFLDKERSGILCFNHPSLPTQQIWQRLEDANIHLAIRGDALRMSPSFYNDEDEVNAMLAALP